MGPVRFFSMALVSAKTRCLTIDRFIAESATLNTIAPSSERQVPQACGVVRGVGESAFLSAAPALGVLGI